MRSTVKKITLIVLLLGLAFSVSGCLKSNDTAVKETVNKFFNALKVENKQQVVDTLDITLPGYQYYPAILDTYFGVNETLSIAVNFTTVTIMEDAATVSALVNEQYVFNGQAGSSQQLFNFTLVKRGNNWKISREDYLAPLFFN